VSFKGAKQAVTAFAPKLEAARFGDIDVTSSEALDGRLARVGRIDERRKLKDTRRLAPRRSSGRCTWLDPTAYNRRRRRFLLV